MQELNSSKEILKILITDSLQIPRYLKKTTFLHYRFDTNFIDKGFPIQYNERKKIYQIPNLLVIRILLLFEIATLGLLDRSGIE